MKCGNNTIFICVFMCNAGFSFGVTCFLSVNYSSARQIKATSNFIKYIAQEARMGKIELMHNFSCILMIFTINYHVSLLETKCLSFFQDCQ